MLHLPRSTGVLFMPAFSTLLLLFFCSCVDRIKTDLIAYKGLDEGLLNSNISISYQTETIMASIEDRMTDPRTSEKAAMWYGTAKKVFELSNQACLYIENLKKELKKEAGGEEKNIESIREDDKIAVRLLFITKGKASALYDRLVKYKKDLLTVDSAIESNFVNLLPTTTGYFESSRNKGDEFFITFFNDLPAVAALAILSKFQNNIRVSENKVIEFCHNQTSRRPTCDFGRYSALAAINSCFIKPGEPVEIVAGVGTFRDSFRPTVVIRGKNIPIDIDGLAHYKFVGSDKPGKHLIPVEISYTDIDGNEKMVTKEISYTVANENKR